MSDQGTKYVVCGSFILIGVLLIIGGIWIKFGVVTALITLGIFLILTGFLGGD